MKEEVIQQVYSALFFKQCRNLKWLLSSKPYLTYDEDEITDRIKLSTLAHEIWRYIGNNNHERKINDKLSFRLCGCSFTDDVNEIYYYNNLIPKLEKHQIQPSILIKVSVNNSYCTYAPVDKEFIIPLWLIDNLVETKKFPKTYNEYKQLIALNCL